MNTLKANTLTWTGLLLLSALGFLARETLHGRGAATVILAAAGLKCAGLAWQFMELRTAHWFWRGALLLLLAAFLGGVGRWLALAG